MKIKNVIFGLSIAIIISALSFLASRSPDGLQRVAQDGGFASKAANLVRAPVPGFIGVITVFILAVLLLRLLKKK